MITTILMIIETALGLVKQQLGSGAAAPIDAAEAITDIIAKAMAAYQQQTGQPIDVSLIKPYEPIP